ncbi:MAG: peptide MFS transporter [Chloroherpetonaceae bacterium]|nr:peptide MFS transporter [Chloroherpetonaceae bacterium]
MEQQDAILLPKHKNPYFRPEKLDNKTTLKMPSTQAATTAPLVSTSADTAFFGHPRGLSTLFFTEMWERFSYYGMRALLILFMTAPVASGGLGFDARNAGAIYSIYTAFVYLLSLPGGWVADKFLGLRRSVFIGGVIIMCGHISLAIPSVVSFYVGLVLVVLGTGLLKPNISALVGQLYAPEDARRDAGFSIYYMGINLGAFAAPLVCGTLAQSEQFKSLLTGWGIDPNSSWHWGFGAAAVGMFLGLVQFVLTGHFLGNAGAPPPRTQGDGGAQQPQKQLLFGIGGTLILLALGIVVFGTGMLDFNADNLSLIIGVGYVVVTMGYFAALFAQEWTPVERNRLIVVGVLFVCAAIFWSAFEQAGSSLNLFADRYTRNTLFGFNFPSSYFQSLNSLFVIVLAPLFAWLWIWLAKRNLEPSSPVKFALGLLGAGIGFVILVPPALTLASAPEGMRVSPMWLVMVYLIHTIAELCLSPVGLSTVTKLAPERVAGQMMGVWFLGASVGNFAGGQIASLFETFPLPQLFLSVFATAGISSLILFLLVKPIRNLMGGVK